MKQVILSWPTPNYANPVTRGNALLVVNSIFIALVVIFVGLRMYTRLIIKRWFGLDDVFILLALVRVGHEPRLIILLMFDRSSLLGSLLLFCWQISGMAGIDISMTYVSTSLFQP